MPNKVELSNQKDYGRYKNIFFLHNFLCMPPFNQLTTLMKEHEGPAQGHTGLAYWNRTVVDI